MRWIWMAPLALMLAAPAEAEMYGATEYKGTETPGYRVERQVGGSELRDYGPTVVAEVTVSGSRSGAANAGFRALAGFIFGGNRANEKIAMTTPVAQVPQDGTAGGPWVVRFTMPASFTRSALPEPDDPRIRITEAPARRMLVTGFSGMPTETALAEALDRLRADAAAAGLATVGAPEFLFYDPPFRLPWNRRNEVALAVR